MGEGVRDCSAKTTRQRGSVLAAGVFKLPDLTGHLGNGIRGQAVVACLAAAVAAVFTVRFLVGYFRTRTLTPFAVYCLTAGVAASIYFAV